MPDTTQKPTISDDPTSQPFPTRTRPTQWGFDPREPEDLGLKVRAFNLLTPNVTAYAREQQLRRREQRPRLNACECDEPESYPGACDGSPCRELATVHHLAAEQDCCLRHFASFHVFSLDGIQ